MKAFLKLDYERISSIGQSPVTQILIKSLRQAMIPYISPDIKSSHPNELTGMIDLEMSQKGLYVASADLVMRALQLCKSSQQWYGRTEDGLWAEMIPIVSAHFIRAEFTKDMKTAWKLDFAIHPRLRFPFNSYFIPDVAYGLMADTSFNENANLSRPFLLAIPTLTEPSFSPFVNEGSPLCFPFLIWERKSDSGEAFKAENQLGLPTVKVLDILEGLGLGTIPIIGLTTLGATWEVWVCHICVPPNKANKVRKLFESYIN